MKIELRNIRINARLSEETNCFSATLYVDGKKVGECLNRGHGGETEVHVPRALHDKLTAWAEANMPDGIRYGYTDNITPSMRGKLVDGFAQYVDLLVDQEIARKSAAKIVRVRDKSVIENAKRGCGTLHWKGDFGNGNADHRFVPIKPGKDPADLAKETSAKHAKQGMTVTWVVVS